MELALLLQPQVHFRLALIKLLANLLASKPAFLRQTQQALLLLLTQQPQPQQIQTLQVLQLQIPPQLERLLPPKRGLKQSLSPS